MRAGDVREPAARAARFLAADPRVLIVYLFGSAAQPGRETVRDVDLGILTVSTLSLDELMRLSADVASASRVPVDLVSLNDASIVLAYEIAETGICVHAKIPDVETEFVTRARARYWDFKPYREEQWRLAGERLKERRIGS